jgi:hypothetical protein
MAARGQVVDRDSRRSTHGTASVARAIETPLVSNDWLPTWEQMAGAGARRTWAVPNACLGTGMAFAKGTRRAGPRMSPTAPEDRRNPADV